MKKVLLLAVAFILSLTFTSCEPEALVDDETKIDQFLKDTGQEEVGDTTDEEDEEDGL